MNACPNTACGFVNEAAATRCVICGTPLEDDGMVPVYAYGYGSADMDEGADKEDAS